MTSLDLNNRALAEKTKQSIKYVVVFFSKVELCLQNEKKFDFQSGSALFAFIFV